MVAHTGREWQRRRLGPALLEAWVGYRRRLEDELATAGFDDRQVPDGRVLRLCTGSDGATISEIGRQLAITRQGASKIVASLRARGYVTLTPSGTDARERLVTPTGRALEYLRAQRDAAQRIERDLRKTLGPDVVEAVYRIRDALSFDDQPSTHDALRRARRRLGRVDE